MQIPPEKRTVDIASSQDATVSLLSLPTELLEELFVHFDIRSASGVADFGLESLLIFSSSSVAWHNAQEMLIALSMTTVSLLTSATIPFSTPSLTSQGYPGRPAGQTRSASHCA